MAGNVKKSRSAAEQSANKSRYRSQRVKTLKKHVEQNPKDRQAKEALSTVAKEVIGLRRPHRQKIKTKGHLGLLIFTPPGQRN